MDKIFMTAIIDVVLNLIIIALIAGAAYLSFDLFKVPQIRRDGKIVADGRILQQKDIPHYKTGAFLLLAIIPCFLGLYHFIFGGPLPRYWNLLLFLVSLDTALIGMKKLLVLTALREHYGDTDE